MPVAPFQYLESHDQSALIAYIGGFNQIAVSADRSRFYKLQPFVFALYTAEGIPMLWEGQEFAANNILPLGGALRINFRRNVHWEFFYDDFGAPLIRLYRRLGALRHLVPALRGRHSRYDEAASRPDDSIVAYWREAPETDQHALVILNFSDQEQTVNVRFPAAGTYREMIDDGVPTILVSDDTPVAIAVPSNYGRVFVNK
jgi:1,4-alpha-glucan branching enzyme